MQLSDYIIVLRRRWWVILLVAAVAAVGAYAFSKLQTPVWRSEASYLVVPNRADQGLAILLQNSMDSYRVTALAPIRNQLISKGMIWSPNHGDTAFTVPQFDEFMRRVMPGEEWKE